MIELTRKQLQALDGPQQPPGGADTAVLLWDVARRALERNSTGCTWLAVASSDSQSQPIGTALAPALGVLLTGCNVQRAKSQLPAPISSNLIER